MPDICPDCETVIDPFDGDVMYALSRVNMLGVLDEVIFFDDGFLEAGSWRAEVTKDPALATEESRMTDLARRLAYKPGRASCGG